MIHRDYDTLVACVHNFCDADTDMEMYSIEAKILLETILVNAFDDEENRDRLLALIDEIREKCEPLPGLLGTVIGEIGYRCYQLRSPALAEWVYRYANDLNETNNSRNNLAYILRRHRNDLHATNAEIIDLLTEGVRRQDSFSLMNMALHFALNLGTENDWRLADRLIKLIAEDSICAVYQWWHDLAAKEDPEGILAVYWLNRHDKLPIPLEQAGDPWIARINDHYSNIPQWFFESPDEI